MEHLFWSLFKTDQITKHIPEIIKFLTFSVFFYHIDSIFLVLLYGVKKIFGMENFVGLSPENQLAAMLAMPTLVRNKDELEGIQDAVMSVVNNRYPGNLYIVPSIDGRDSSEEICKELESWIDNLNTPPNIKIFFSWTDKRSGKAMALEKAIHKIKSLDKEGKLPESPKVFFCFDADSEIREQSLERMVYRLTSKSKWTGESPLIVTSNVKIAKKQYWNGLSQFFTIRGFLALGVAAEYTALIGVAKHNFSLAPVTVASGALYCTWFDFPAMSAEYASFLTTLKWTDVIKWWFGGEAVKFELGKHKPMPEALTGEGDDTWMTWLACSGFWDEGKISVQFPATPLHALGRLLKKMLFRPLAYDPLAQVYTKTPTTIKALFKQRHRWNGSGSWNTWRLRKTYGFLVNIPMLVAVWINVFVYFSLTLGWLTTPLALIYHMNWFIELSIALYFLSTISRSLKLALSFMFDDKALSEWHKFLFIPFYPVYHFFFNSLSAMKANFENIFGMGAICKFAPEITLIKGRSSRIALGYRLRRMLILSLRSIIKNDVPLGWFWFGWYETPWTSNGYVGWDKESHPSIWEEINHVGEYESHDEKIVA